MAVIGVIHCGYGGEGHCPVRSSISSLLILRAKQAKEWMMKNAIKDQSTGCIIPGQVLLHPDGKTLFIVCPPNNGVQIRHHCLGCFHVNIPSRMKRHISSYGNLGRASTAVNGINESLSRLHLHYQLPGTQSTKTKDKWSTSEVKIWIENNANRDPLTRQIIRNGIRYLASTR